MKNILVAAAHPDDEVIGCGGTIARHVAEGDKVFLLIFADGESARQPSGQVNKKSLEKMRERAAAKCGQKLGISEIRFLRLPDNQLDTLPMLSLVRSVEDALAEWKPETVYTHYGHDLNMDHKQVFQATITACRPYPDQCVREILLFETLSSTEWIAPIDRPFSPNRFVDISRYLDQKVDALKAYQKELRSFPHPRSLDGVIGLARVRGQSVGISVAESFELVREIN
jgi:N-acetylglucosamine malate deacetylase 1